MLETIEQSLNRRRNYWVGIERAGLAKEEMQLCAESPVHWANHWAYTYDPRQPQKVIPFDLFPKQAEFFDWLQEREQKKEDGLVEKSRDMGATWLCCAYALHGWLYRPGFSAGFGSRKLELVDRRGDLDSIFEKIRFMLERLPPWMRPAGYRSDAHDNVARLVNPANGASLTGEGGDNIGRGGRKSLYFVDEAAFLDRPQLVDRSLSATTNVRIDVSTPNGPGNPFAEKRHSGRVPVFTLHWRNDPRKGEAWYAEQKEKKDAVTIAQEIDIDYTASVEGICIPAAWVRAAVDLHVWAKKNKGIEFPQTELPVAGLDVAAEGKNKNVFLDRVGVVVRGAETWGNCNLTETAWKAAELAEKRGVKRLNYDGDAIGASLKGTWKTSERKLSFQHNGIMGGGSPTESHWPGGKTSKELFVNFRAEGWWCLRIRFEKAYEFREKGIAHPVDEMISIPDHPALIAQLSQPLRQFSSTGKIKIESKEDMRKRGISSPDHADALYYCFAPSGTWKLRADMFKYL